MPMPNASRTSMLFLGTLSLCRPLQIEQRDQQSKSSPPSTARSMPSGRQLPDRGDVDAAAVAGAGGAGGVGARSGGGAGAAGARRSSMRCSR